MSTAAAAPEKTTEAEAKPGGRRRLLLLAIPVVIAGVGAGLWFTGILPPLLGMGKKEEGHEGAEAAGGHAAGGHGGGAAAGEHAAGGHGAEGSAAGKEGSSKAPTFIELPEMIANLNAPAGRRSSYVKVRARIELARPEDAAATQAAMPRLQDMFQTYLREMRPDELRGSAGTWRLREELLARANIALAPARVVDVLFTEMLIQ
jgi:flagellar FliL protein